MLNLPKLKSIELRNISNTLKTMQKTEALFIALLKLYLNNEE